MYESSVQVPVRVDDKSNVIRLRGRENECPVCGHPYDNHVKGECPENIKGQLELSMRVLERYVPRARARMQMSIDISRLEYLMSLYKGAR
jgi:DNA repair exonuclease SbcCD ATPase subunit